MGVERAAGNNSLIEVLDRVLDKGIVIDAWVRVSLVGIDLVTVEARVVVASIATYLHFSDVVGTSTASVAPLLSSVTTPNGTGPYTPARRVPSTSLSPHRRYARRPTNWSGNSNKVPQT